MRPKRGMFCGAGNAGPFLCLGTRGKRARRTAIDCGRAEVPDRAIVGRGFRLRRPLPSTHALAQDFPDRGIRKWRMFGQDGKTGAYKTRTGNQGYGAAPIHYNVGGGLFIIEWPRGLSTGRLQGPFCHRRTLILSLSASSRQACPRTPAQSASGSGFDRLTVGSPLAELDGPCNRPEAEQDDCKVPIVVTLSAAKGLAAQMEIFRCAQNDRLPRRLCNRHEAERAQLITKIATRIITPCSSG